MNSLELPLYGFYRQIWVNYVNRYYDKIADKDKDVFRSLKDWDATYLFNGSIRFDTPHAKTAFLLIFG